MVCECRGVSAIMCLSTWLLLLGYALAGITAAPFPPCVPGGVMIALAAAADLEGLAAAVTCTGGKVSATWTGTILVPRTIVVGPDTTLELTGAADAVADGGSATRLFRVYQGARLTLTGMSLVNGAASGPGDAGGAVLLESLPVKDAPGADGPGASLSAKACVFEGHAATTNGGAIAGGSKSIVDIKGSTFAACKVVASGGGSGAINVGMAATLNLVDVSFLECQASYGGAVYMEPNATANITGGTFIRNAGDFGGAVYGEQTANVTIANTTFDGNTAVQEGGAIFADNELHGKFLTFKRNTAVSFGGSISVGEGNVTLNDVTMSDSSAQLRGGAVFVGNGNFRCTRCNFRHNSATGGGGSVYGIGDKGNITIELVSTTVKNSTSDADGGAVYASGHVALTMTSCTLDNNTGRLGGALALKQEGEGATLSITDVVFSSNTAFSGGGALYVASAAASAVVSTSTFMNNASPNGGAVLIDTDDTMRLAFDKCGFSANSATSGGGGGVLQLGDKVTVDLATSTFADNTAKCCYAAQPQTVVDAGCSDVTAGFSISTQCCTTGEYVALDEATDRYSCTLCDPETMTCTGAAVSIRDLPLQSGYWRASFTTSDIKECYNDDACIGQAPPAAGAKATVDGYCASAYQGPYCAVCRDNYSSVFGYQCIECNNAVAAVGTVLAVVALAVIGGIVAWLFCGGGSTRLQQALEQSQGPTVLKKPAAVVAAILLRNVRIPLVMLQVLTQFASITNVLLPAAYKKFLYVMRFVNFDWSWLLSLTCSLKVSFYNQLLLCTLVPLCLAALMLVPRLLLRLGVCERWPAFAGARSRLDQLRAHEQRAVLILAFLVYGGTSSVILQTYGCEDFPGGQSYLRADYSISCKASTHTAYQVYAGFMIALFPIGIPALLMWVLRHDATVSKLSVSRSALNSTDSSRGDPFDATRLGSFFLREPYRPHLYFWETVECARRLLLTGLLVRDTCTVRILCGARHVPCVRGAACPLPYSACINHCKQSHD
eukprot:TRINITY_DN969_c0_g3_i3.p1 TRINITY_DN969_c0_g3~~TRINITY_DN969_c0_g3_i3.p1  ORF type:complete len:1006 (+),score=214.17 TRINITY_DN969_c0_g3_i3:240-3257(+)